MFTQTNFHGASIETLRTAFRHAAQAEARRLTTVPDTTGLPRRSGSEALRPWGRAAAVAASVLISFGLLGSVVLGMTSMASPADSTLAKTVPLNGTLIASK